MPCGERKIALTAVSKNLCGKVCSFALEFVLLCEWVCWCVSVEFDLEKFLRFLLFFSISVLLGQMFHTAKVSAVFSLIYQPKLTEVRYFLNNSSKI